ncbi:MAG: hypothetical protein IT384_09855 [Deltaproteobacteria bacterium]|nr:hypothetical protein [Deltaproteobacteria bacterium]
MSSPISSPGPVTGSSTFADGGAAASATKPLGKASLDLLETKELTLHAVKRTPLGELVDPVGARISNTFPLDDLSKIGPSGRWACGFRLDGGGLRLMWLTARRTIEKDGAASFEIFFQTHGLAVERFHKRLKEKGATPYAFNFEGAAIDPNVDPATAIPKKTGETWSPSGGDGLTLLQPGKFAVDFVAQKPEALKGALRIKLFGSDAECSASLKEVVNRLGLHALFAPPTPATLEKFKLFRVLWAEAPELADKLRYRPLEALSDPLGEALIGAGMPPSHAERQMIAKAQLDQPAIARRVKLAALLYARNPSAFVEWAKSDGYSVNGILPNSLNNSNNEHYLNNALQKIGLPTTHADYQAALAASIASEAQARTLLELGLLIKKNAGAAEEVLLREVDAIKIDQLKETLSEAGIDPAGERIKNLRFEEVYPGYFTVIDPSLPDRLFQAGARYLYSTADNAERVWQMLSGGQKASMTRFREGAIVQGKSSSADFGTGGAFSVFTRLVTKSAVQRGKTGNSSGNFMDWGGSRPYKLLLNRRLLGRLDWYGYNGDNYGRTTGLTAENKTEKIIRTIDRNYSQSNELMFPVGNDAAYVDFVVCSSDQQKSDLINFLKGKGIESFNGKTLDDLVRVSQRFFDHPDDITVASTVYDTLENSLNAPLTQTVDAKVRALAKPALEAAADEAAKTTATKAAQTTARTQAESYAVNPALSAARQAVQAAPAETKQLLNLDAAKDVAKLAARAQAKIAALSFAGTVDNHNTYQIDQRVRNLVQQKYQEIFGNAASQAATEAAAATPKPADASAESQAAVRATIEGDIRSAVQAALSTFFDGEGKTAADDEAQKVIAATDSWSLRTQARTAAEPAAASAAVSAVPAAAIEQLAQLAEAPAKAAAASALQSQVNNYGLHWISGEVREATRVAIEAKGFEVARTPALEAAASAHTAMAHELAQAAIAGFQQAYPSKPAALDVAEASKRAIEELSTPVIERVVKELAQSTANAKADAASKEAIAAVAPELIEAVSTSAAKNAARTAAEEPIRQASQEILNEVVEAAAKEAIEEAKGSVGPALAEKALTLLLPQLEAQWVAWAIGQYANAAVQTVLQKT